MTPRIDWPDLLPRVPCKSCRKVVAVRPCGVLWKHTRFVVYDPILDPAGSEGYREVCPGGPDWGARFKRKPRRRAARRAGKGRSK